MSFQLKFTKTKNNKAAVVDVNNYKKSSMTHKEKIKFVVEGYNTMPISDYLDLLARELNYSQ